MTRPWLAVPFLSCLAVAWPAGCGDDGGTDDGRSDATGGDSATVDGAADADARDDAGLPPDGDHPDGPDDQAADDGGMDEGASGDGGMDDGGTILDVVPRPLGVVADRQDLVADALGRLYLIRSVRRTLYAGRIEGLAVVDEVEVSAPELSGWAARPLAAVTPDGSRLHVVWVGPNAARASRLHHAERDPAGVWHEETVLDGGTSFYAEPAVAAGGDGTVHVVAQHWADGVDSQPVVYTWRNTAGTWSEPVRISPEAGAHRDIATFTDPAGGVHAVYAGLTHAYSRHAPPGTLLSDAPQLEIPKRDDHVNNFYGDLFVAPGGTVHRAMATWNRPAAEATIDHSTRSPTGAWSVPEIASGGPLPSTLDIETRPAIGAARDGTVFILWGEADADGHRCRLAVREDGGWTVRTIDDTAGIGSQQKPSVAVTDDAVTAVWRHDDGELWIAELWRRP